MHIGIDASRATATSRTGTELYSLRLIEALLSLDQPHHFRLYFNRRPDLSLLAPADASDRIVHKSIPFPRLWTHVRLGLEIAAHPPDVLFVPSHVLPLWTRAPAVATVHDLGYLYFPEAHPPRQRWYLDWSTRHNARVARIVVADSEITKQDLVKHYGVRPDKVVVAYPGIDDDLAPVHEPDAITAVKRRYGIDDDYIIHIGTLQPRKNLSHLVQAFSQLSSFPQMQLALVGKKGWLYDDLFSQVQRLGLQGRVIFPGYVADSDKAALLSGAAACVFPSLYEGFGFPALEAQACETPLVCSNSSSLPEVVGDGALLVDPVDVDGLAGALTQVLTDADLRADLIARGRRNRQRFSWGACAESVMATLEAAAQV